MDLSTARMIKRMTQWDMRKVTGIHQSKISLIERGYVIPSEKERAAIAEALGVAASEIQWPAENLSQCSEAIC